MLGVLGATQHAPRYLRGTPDPAPDPVARREPDEENLHASCPAVRRAQRIVEPIAGDPVMRERPGL